MKHVMRPLQRLMRAVIGPYIADIEFQPRIVERRAHLFLLLLVAAEDAYLGYVGGQEASQDMLTERSRAAGDNHNLVGKHHVLALPERSQYIMSTSVGQSGAT